MSDEKPPMRFVGVGTEGMVFTDGSQLYMVWASKTPGLIWSGTPIEDVDCAFVLSDTYWCGAEVDMRESDEDPVTPEVLETNDRMAEALTQFFREGHKRMEKETP